MHNVGSIFRTSDGAGVAKIYLTGFTPCPPRKEIHKTALGAEEVVPWEYHEDPIILTEKLKKKGVKIVALEKNAESQDINAYIPQSEVCMIVGNEIDGVEPPLLALADQVLHIPMRGKKESLNVSVAFGVGVYRINNTGQI